MKSTGSTTMIGVVKHILGDLFTLSLLVGKDLLTLSYKFYLSLN